LSRRAIKAGLQHAIAELKTDISAEIQQTISRELAKLELVTCTSSAALSSSRAQLHAQPDPMPASAPATATETANEERGCEERESNHDQDGVVISQATGKQIYSMIESTENLIAYGRAGKMRLFEKEAEGLELLITLLDNELLSQVNLTGEPAPTN
jgi:hypothetical protein